MLDAFAAIIQSRCLCCTWQMAVAKLVMLQGSFGAVVTDEKECLSLLIPVSLLNTEPSQGPEVYAGLWGSHETIKVSEGQGLHFMGRGMITAIMWILIQYLQLPLPLLPASSGPSQVSPSPWMLSILFSGDWDASGFLRKGLIAVAVSLGGAGRPVMGSKEGLSGDGWVTWHPRGWRGVTQLCLPGPSWDLFPLKFCF